MEYDLIGNVMGSLNEAIDYYKSGKEYKGVYGFQGTIYCEDCGEEIPDSPYNYVLAQSYYDSDNYMFLCKECGKKLYESEIGVEYEIQ